MLNCEYVISQVLKANGNQQNSEAWVNVTPYGAIWAFTLERLQYGRLHASFEEYEQ